MQQPSKAASAKPVIFQLVIHRSPSFFSSCAIATRAEGSNIQREGMLKAFVGRCST
jgi:hypothetical protein